MAYEWVIGMSGKSKVKKGRRDRYLAITYSILNLRGIGLCQKVLLAHIYSFGQKGCYQSNETLAEIFMVSPYTISRWIAHVRKYLYVKNPKGYYRTMWAKAHPEVQATAERCRKSGGNCTSHLGKSKEHVVQKSGSDFAKSEAGLEQRCVTTNNKTNIETNKETTTPLPPLPAGGQAAAALTDRKKQSLAEIEKFKRSFGQQAGKPLTEEEFDRRRQRMLKALLASPGGSIPQGAG
jgi:hypothetical protein